jgi:uncharacterized protein (TIGR02996 family)
MTPDNPFLRALLAQPDDDTLRLAMADWLDEHDQPARAEFVRVQVELARGVADRARRRALELRQSQLLFAHDAEWVAPLAKVLGLREGEWGGWVFRRGFVEYFHLPAAVVNKYGARLAELTPVRELFLRPVDAATVTDLCKQPWVMSLSHLYLHDLRITDPVATAALRSPYLIDLRVLQCGCEELSATVRQKFQARFPLKP